MRTVEWVPFSCALGETTLRIRASGSWRPVGLVLPRLSVACGGGVVGEPVEAALECLAKVGVMTLLSFSWGRPS